jgi:hypothetical protein
VVDEEGGPVDLLQLLRVVRRWWVVVVPMLLATTILTWVVVDRVPVYRQAEGKIIIESPRLSAEGAPSGSPAGPTENPFAVYDPSLSIVGTVVAEVLDDAAMRDRLAELGASQDYSIESEDLWDAPILSVHAVSRQADVAVQTVQIVTSAVQEELLDQQEAAGADPGSYVTARALITSEHTTLLYGGRVRSGLVCLVLGGGSTILAALALDRRRRRRLVPELDPPVGHGAGRRSTEAASPAASSWA